MMTIVRHWWYDFSIHNFLLCFCKFEVFNIKKQYKGRVYLIINEIGKIVFIHLFSQQLFIEYPQASSPAICGPMLALPML